MQKPPELRFVLLLWIFNDQSSPLVRCFCFLAAFPPRAFTLFCPLLASSCLNWCLKERQPFWFNHIDIIIHANCTTCQFHISPGLPASAAVPHSAERRKPVGAGLRAVVEVGAHPVCWELLKLLLLFCNRLTAGIIQETSTWAFDQILFRLAL